MSYLIYAYIELTIIRYQFRLYSFSMRYSDLLDSICLHWKKIKSNVCIVERIFGPINGIFNKQRTPLNSKLIVFSENNKLEWQHTNGLAKKQHKTHTHKRTQKQQQHKMFQTGLKWMKFAIKMEKRVISSGY